jgi:hypothetical protein
MANPRKSVARRATPSQLSRGVLKTIAGVAVSDRKDLVRLIAHAGDQMLKGDFSRTLHDTYVYLANKGSIDPAYLDSTKLADLAPEFRQVEDGDFGIEQLNALRKIFANLAIVGDSQINAKFLLDIGLSMSELEIRVLLADFKLASKELTDTEYRDLRNSNQWVKTLSIESGLELDELVVEAEDGLMQKRLISGRMLSDRSGVNFIRGKSRLTDTGFALCKLMILEDDPLQAPENS